MHNMLAGHQDHLKLSFTLSRVTHCSRGDIIHTHNLMKVTPLSLATILSLYLTHKKNCKQ